jgi:hypothetical protein
VDSRFGEICSTVLELLEVSFPQDAPLTAFGDTDLRDLLARWRRRRRRQKSSKPIKAASASKPSTTPRAIAVVRFLRFRAFAAAIAAAADDEVAAASAVFNADWVEVKGMVRVGLVDEVVEDELVEDENDEIDDDEGEGKVDVANVLVGVACSLETTWVAISRA